MISGKMRQTSINHQGVVIMLWMCFFAVRAASMVLPVTQTLAMIRYESRAEPSDTDMARRRAIYLTSLASGMDMGGGWRAHFLSMTIGMPGAIAVDNLEQLYDGIMELTQPGTDSGPLNRHFGYSCGNLEIILQTMDSSLAIPWDVVYSFVSHARDRAALGFAGLYHGYIQDAAGQAVLFALQLRRRYTPEGNFIG